MYFYLIGVDYNTASVDIRDDFYRQRKEIINFWGADEPLKEPGILFTCNRIEIYAAADNLDEALSRISEFRKRFPVFLKYASIKYGHKEVFKHLIRLACGLESQLKGEQEIFLQLIKLQQYNSAGFWFKNMLFEAVSLSDEIRIETGLNTKNYNVADVIFHDLSKQTVLHAPLEVIVLGTGKIAQLIARSKPPEAKINFAAHKNYLKATALAEYSGGEAFFLKDLPQVISKIDVIVSAAKSPHYILKKSHFLDALSKRKNKLYVYDLSMPRGIDPQVKDLENVFLQDADDLKHVFSYFNDLNKTRLARAAQLIESRLKNWAEADIWQMR